MVKIRGDIHKFGNDLWQARVLKRYVRRDDLRVRHKNGTHAIETNVAIEKWSSEDGKYVNALKIQPGKYRDDVRFWCSALSNRYIYLHHIVYYLSLGLPLTKKRYDAWRAECAAKNLEVDRIDSGLFWRVTTSTVDLLDARVNRRKK